ncbi:M24 family metallopeptidase [Escherichia coli]
MQEVTGEVVRIMVSGLVKLGILKGDVDELIAQNAHRPFFMHGLSHWLGLDVHDVGVYGQDCSRILEPGMVLTVEPAVCISRRMRMCQNNIAVSAFVLKTTL